MGGLHPSVFQCSRFRSFNFCYFVFSAGLEESQDWVDKLTGALGFLALLLEKSARDAGHAGKLECHIPFSRAELQQQAAVLLLHSRGSRVT